jgi:hypothetical protein
MRNPFSTTPEFGFSVKESKKMKKRDERQEWTPHRIGLCLLFTFNKRFSKAVLDPITGTNQFKDR